VDRRTALGRVLFLRGLPSETLAEIAAVGFERSYSVGGMVFSEGDRCLGLIVILSGAVRVSKFDSRGREIVLSVERAGSSIGDLALFDGGTYPACATAVEEDTRLLIVARDRFMELEQRYPAIASGAIRALSVQSRKLIEMLKAQALHTVRSRIAAYLLHTAGEERTFPLSETNAAIGSHIGTVREVVSRTLHQLEDIGAIRIAGRTITLVNREILRQIAEQDSD
jgi:CRP/FNR family transcriptional regulator, dissimilatory nitrate respiration regulator